jgi:pyrroline-5-carboxylate reductase
MPPGDADDTTPAGPAPLQFLGGGRMADALLGGLLASGRVAPADVVVVEIDPARRDQLAADRPGVRVVAEPVAAHDVVVATKPADVTAALVDATDAGLQRVLSIAAGVTTSALEATAGSVPVLRSMPNTPALVGAGAAALCAGRHAGPADEDWAEGVLASVGTVTRVPEHLMDAVTGLSGSGPAYVFLMAEALTDAGVLAGLPRAAADALVRQTLLGAATLLSRSDDGPEALRAQVTSPGGTTAAGLRVLEDRAVRAALIAAVAAAGERSAELGA